MDSCQLYKTKQNWREEYHHNIAIAAVLDSVYGCLYFIAKTPQAEAKGTDMLTYGIWRAQTLLLALCTIQSRWKELLQYINPMDQLWTFSWPQLAISAVSSTFQLLTIYIIASLYNL